MNGKINYNVISRIKLMFCSIYPSKLSKQFAFILWLMDFETVKPSYVWIKKINSEIWLVVVVLVKYDINLNKYLI